MTAVITARTTKGQPSARPALTHWMLRLHRPALYVWTGFVVVVAGALLWLRGPLTDASAAAWRQWDACQAEVCTYDQDSILLYKDIYEYTTYAVLAIPFLVAAWTGAALIGRELESGTAQLAWTQSISPVRWLAAKLTLPAALITVGTGLLVLLHRLAWTAGEGRIGSAKSWYDAPTFHANGPTTIALALAGLALGTLVGLLWRRSLAALGTAVAALAGLWTALVLTLPHLWPPVTSVGGLRANGAPGVGLDVSDGMLTSTGARIPNPWCGSTVSTGCDTLYAKLDAVSFYRDYHPASHYWPLQLTASALLLAVAALLVLVAFRLLKRRTTGATP